MKSSPLPHTITRMLWIPLLALVVGVPVVSWALKAPFADSLASSYLMLTLLGQFTGIVGAQLFAFALVLSARLRFMEFFFGGLDRLYVIHHRVGVIAFSLLAIHPIILAFRFIQDSIEDVMWYLMPFNNSPAREYGVYALLLMLTLLFLTFYGSVFSYPALKNAHRFMGGAFFLGTLHMFFIPSSMGSDIVLKVSCLGLALIGCLAFTYRTLLGKFLVSRYPYSVSAVADLGQGVTEITLSPRKKVLHHMPGQFAMLSFLGSKVVPNEEHPFTISSSRDNGDVRFSIKALGDYTGLLPGLTIGTKALLEGPFGEFTYSHGSKKQIWIAGGIGVTPFVSMAEDLLAQDAIDYTIDFYYSVRSEKDGAYKNLFDSLAKKHKGFIFHFMPSDTSGYVTGEGVAKDISDAPTRDIFICGPPGMMAALTASLVASHIPVRKIHTERFALLK